ncbi:hypothetical protein [Variovorax sp. PAMC26660]|uniref:hypothetical protein n=1 Tax=Variovorax sp. PAMC26660 TaxID=2762322 RepID=UPI00164D17B4|nr:hypothetical protein [Variovorax sp. PAMC26660]QNK69837.1 hypothetical protein H7F35_09180 [Variovorax sp. PAMC26660]
MRAALPVKKALARWILGSVGVLAIGCAWAQDGKPQDPAALKKVLASGGGVFESRNSALLLSPKGNFIFNMAFGMAGRGINSGMSGTWRTEKGTGHICLLPPSPEPMLFAAPGAPTNGKASLAFRGADLRRAAIVKAGERFDGPAAVKEVRERLWDDEPQAGAPPPAISVDIAAKFVHVAVPVERTAANIEYVTHKFALDGKTGGYLVAYRSGTSPFDPAAGNAKELCLAPEELAFEQARVLAAGEATAIDERVKAAIDPETLASPDGKESGYRRIRPVAKASFFAPPSTVTLTLRETDTAKLFRIATQVLDQGGASFSQSSRQGKESSEAKGLVLGSAGGPNSASEFDVQVQILAQGEVRVTALSRRDPIAVNAESPIASSLAGQIQRAVESEKK